MRRCVIRTLVLLVFLSGAAFAHDIHPRGKVVIDTDLGLDDAVALALALQNPDWDIKAITASEGAAGRERGVESLQRMLTLFNRGDIKLYKPAERDQPLPPPVFREFAEYSVGRALSDTPADGAALAFSPDAFSAEDEKIVIMALGPLTNIAAALRLQPDLKNNINAIVCAGGSEPAGNWNLRFDPAAFEAVKAAGVRLEFVAAEDRAARKPDAWRSGELKFGSGTSIGETFVSRLLADPNVRSHYLERFDAFSDELVPLYLADETVFWGKSGDHAWTPNNRATLGDLFTRLLADGRQGKSRVILIPGSLPEQVLQPDLRQRKKAILEKNGETEWFAQLLMNELHEHLGAYSIIGVKMGLRAAELLNAPQHGMKITSRVPGHPPFSCLNDGLIVSTGCTPGRMLFRHEPGDDPKSASVLFEYNDRRVSLSLKPEYQQALSTKFQAILTKYSESDPRYWGDVRELGFDIWENWHRGEIFDVRFEVAKPIAE